MTTRWNTAALREAETKLTRLLADLEDEVEHIEAAVLEPSGDPHGQRADEPAEDAAFERERPSLAAAAIQAAAVRDALARLRAGTYGRCERCGKSIERARLNLVPYASACAPCARAIEAGATG